MLQCSGTTVRTRQMSSRIAASHQFWDRDWWGSVWTPSAVATLASDRGTINDSGGEIAVPPDDGASESQDVSTMRLTHPTTASFAVEIALPASVRNNGGTVSAGHGGA